MQSNILLGAKRHAYTYGGSSSTLRETTVSTFLDDRKLGPAIADLMKGAGLRCAVAFWGNGAAAKLFQNGRPPVNARIICDLAMGGSNPKELRALGAPSNEGLKHLRGLHAKVYLSDQGLITCSANASNNGIGFLETPGLVEAGTFHPPKTDAYLTAARWFETIWGRAETVDEPALDRAQRAWVRRSAGNNNPSLPERPLNPASLLDTVIADPGRFRGVGFAFTNSNATIRQRDEAVAAVIKEDKERALPLLSKNGREALPKWPVGHVFAEWPREDISAWPMRFVCAHRGARGRLFYLFYERAYAVVLEGNRGMVLARRLGNLRRDLGFRRGAQSMAEVDDKKASFIFEYIEESGGQLYENGEELARLLATLAPWC